MKVTVKSVSPEAKTAIQSTNKCETGKAVGYYTALVDIAKTHGIDELIGRQGPMGFFGDIAKVVYKIKLQGGDTVSVTESACRTTCSNLWNHHIKPCVDVTEDDDGIKVYTFNESRLAKMTAKIVNGTESESKFQLRKVKAKAKAAESGSSESAPVVKQADSIYLAWFNKLSDEGQKAHVHSDIGREILIALLAAK